MNLPEINSRWTRYFTVRTLYVLFLGQVVSFVLALSSFCSSLIANLGADAPLTQGFFGYLSLALVYGSIFLYKRQKLQVSWHWYLLLGFVDVQGNYCFNQAFQFTSITSLTLLDCFTVAWVIVLTWLFLSTRYSTCQLFGATLCFFGLALVLFSDSGVGGRGGSRRLLGDALVIAATLFYALCNTAEEFCIKKTDRVEVLSMFSLSGVLLSAVEISIVERKSLQSLEWSAELILAFTGYTLSLFVFYSITPSVLKLSGSTMFNLSLLTSDMWAVFIRIFLYHQQVGWLYYLALAIVSIGLIVYSTGEKDQVLAQDLEPRGSNVQYQVLHNDISAPTSESWTP